MAAVTSYQDVTMSVSAIGGRTDAEGDDVTDFSAEEARFLAEIFTEGYVKPTDSFKVQPADTPAMSVVVGSGTAKSDFYVVAGDTSGQGRYIVRLDATGQSVTVPAADASQARTDEVYLVVADDTYDAGGLSLPRIGYRKGDVGGGDPGPDTSWEAYALLATISVPALETAIETANITDERATAMLISSLSGGSDAIPDTVVDAKGDLIVGTAADTVARLPVGSDDQVLVADSAETAGMKWATMTTGAVAEVAAFTTTADQDTTSSTAVDVTDMSFTVEANSTYVFHMVIAVGQASSGAAQLSLAAPAGATVAGRWTGVFASGSSFQSRPLTSETPAAGNTTDLTNAIANTALGSVSTTSTAGTVRLQFRSSSGTVRVHAGAFGYAMKLA